MLIKCHYKVISKHTKKTLAICEDVDEFMRIFDLTEREAWYLIGNRNTNYKKSMYPIYHEIQVRVVESVLKEDRYEIECEN